MAGIYLHIPFCTRKCHYCNFFSLASRRHFDLFPDVLIRELSQQRHYLGEQEVDTIYFGGGTPSLLSPSSIEKILDEIRHSFRLAPEAEITLESNPDELSPEKLKGFKNAGINRLSIGIQSFHFSDLRYLNRTHSAGQAMAAVEASFQCGFTNLGIDLIYGIPGLTAEGWAQNLETAFSLGLQHISAYALTVEPHTALEVRIRKGLSAEVVEDAVADHFRQLMRKMREQGYLHYEISNFCRPGFESRHNSNYWSGASYLGAGPSAHSYNGHSRRWNVSTLGSWLSKISAGEICYEEERLSPVQKHNEYVMTSLRTMQGCDTGRIATAFGESIASDFRKHASRYVDSGNMAVRENVYFLTDEGKLFADGISAALFAGEDAF